MTGELQVNQDMAQVLVRPDVPRTRHRVLMATVLLVNTCVTANSTVQMQATKVIVVRGWFYVYC